MEVSEANGHYCFLLPSIRDHRRNPSVSVSAALTFEGGLFFAATDACANYTGFTENLERD